MKHVVIASILFVFATAVHAASSPSDDATDRVAQAIGPELHQLSDPAEYADDLCWVAPEWRDDLVSVSRPRR